MGARCSGTGRLPHSRRRQDQTHRPSRTGTAATVNAPEARHPTPPTPQHAAHTTRGGRQRLNQALLDMGENCETPNPQKPVRDQPKQAPKSATWTRAETGLKTQPWSPGTNVLPGIIPPQAFFSRLREFNRNHHPFQTTFPGSRRHSHMIADAKYSIPLAQHITTGRRKDSP